MGQYFLDYLYKQFLDYLAMIILFVIVTRFAENFPISPVWAIKIVCDCCTCCRNWPKATVADTSPLVSLRELALIIIILFVCLEEEEENLSIVMQYHLDYLD